MVVQAARCQALDLGATILLRVAFDDDLARTRAHEVDERPLGGVAEWLPGAQSPSASSTGNVGVQCVREEQHARGAAMASETLRDA